MDDCERLLFEDVGCNMVYHHLSDIPIGHRTHIVPIWLSIAEVMRGGTLLDYCCQYDPMVQKG